MLFSTKRLILLDTATSGTNIRNGCCICRCSSSQWCESSTDKLYKQNSSGWVFSNFVSLQLTLWHLDPLRAGSFAPLPDWIQTRRTAVNVRGTGNDCFKWVVLAGLHPVDANAHRMHHYTNTVSKYDFSSLHFPVPLYSVGCFTTTNNMPINVYGVDDDKKVIYPHCFSSTLVPDRHVDFLLFECNGIQHYTTIRNFTRLVSSQISNHEHTVNCCKQCMHTYKTQELLDAHAADCFHVQRTKFPYDLWFLFINIEKQFPAPFVVDSETGW